MTRVVLATRRLSGVVGGMEVQISRIAGMLARKGYQVGVMSLDETGSAPPAVDLTGISWIPIGDSSADVPASTSRRIRRQAAVLRFLQDYQPQVVLAFQQGMTLLLTPATSILRIPLVALERSAPTMYSSLPSWKRLALQGSLLGATKVVVQWPEFAEGYPLPVRRRIEWIPNAIAPALTATCGSGGTLTWAGRWSYPKQLVPLVKAFARIHRDFPNAHLRIFGDGPDRPLVLDEISRMDSAERESIQIYPFAPHPASFLDGTDAFLSVSLWEGFPNAVAEALAAGVPVGAIDCYPGISNLVRNGINGWLLKGPSDESAIYELLGQILESPLLGKFDAGVIKETVSPYDEREIADRWDHLVESLVRSRV